MARCMLCSSTVGTTDVVCPHCGGAVEEEPGDAPHDVTRVSGIDLTKVDVPPAAETAWPGEAPGPFPPPPQGAPYAPPGGWGAGTYPGFTYGPPSGGYGAGGYPGYGPYPGYGSPPYGPPAGYGYGAPGAYGAVPAWPGYVPPRPTEGLALGSFVTSLVGLLSASVLFVPILACPVGAVLGHLALRRIAEKGTQGRGLALAGVIIGWIGTALLVLGTIVLVAVIAAGV